VRGVIYANNTSEGGAVFTIRLPLTQTGWAGIEDYKLNKIKSQLFEILNFGHCDLFGICVLLFGIFYLLTPLPRPNLV